MPRAKNGKWQKGTSGNPGGRYVGVAAVQAEVQRLAGEHHADAIAALYRLLDDEDGRVVVAAARELLDRGAGKPTMAIAATVTANAAPPPLDLSALTDEELKTLIRIQAKAMPASDEQSRTLVLAAASDANDAADDGDEDTGDGSEGLQ